MKGLKRQGGAQLRNRLRCKTWKTGRKAVGEKHKCYCRLKESEREHGKSAGR